MCRYNEYKWTNYQEEVTLDYLEGKIIPENEDMKIVKKKFVKKEVSDTERFKKFKK